MEWFALSGPKMRFVVTSPYLRPSKLTCPHATNAPASTPQTCLVTSDSAILAWRWCYTNAAVMNEISYMFAVCTAEMMKCTIWTGSALCWKYSWLNELTWFLSNLKLFL